MQSYFDKKSTEGPAVVESSESQNARSQNWKDKIEVLRRKKLEQSLAKPVSTDPSD